MIKKVIIWGVGLMGGSFALALRRKKVARQILGIFRNKRRLKKACNLGIVDEGILEKDIREVVEEDCCIVMALPVYVIIEKIRFLKDLDYRDCWIMDMGSTKYQIIKEAKRFFKDRFVGVHPLAGSEKSGFEYADSRIFEKSICIICEDSPASIYFIRRTASIFKKIGSKVVYMNSKTHDKILAFTSHLPHLLSFGLSLTVPSSFLEYSSGGLRSMLRISKSTPSIWRDVFFSNVKELKKCLKNFRGNLTLLEKAIEDKDARCLESLLKKSQSKSLKI